MKKHNMTARDYFAGQIVVGLVTFENGERLNKLFGLNNGLDPLPAQYFAQVAYMLADAMVAEGDKKKV